MFFLKSQSFCLANLSQNFQKTGQKKSLQKYRLKKMFCQELMNWIFSRKTQVKKTDLAIEQLQQEKTAVKILTALRELAKKDNSLAEVLRTHNLLDL